MKKLLFVMMAIIAISVPAIAEKVSVTFSYGSVIEGNLINQTDSTFLLKTYNSDKELLITPENVAYVLISGIGRYIVEDGKFVPDAKAQAKLEKMRPQKREQLGHGYPLPANPNEVIGNAFKSAGGLCMGIGIPSLLAGSILVAYGYAGIETLPQNIYETEKKITKGKCATAGCVLLPFGAALTVVGIPLYAHGKRIAELKFNYTGNGAGVRVEF